MGNLDYEYKLNKIIELLKSEHGDCEDTTCDIASCLNHGFELWAVKLFSSTGASSKEFDRLYNKLPSKFSSDAEKEREEFVNTIPSVSCPHCNAVVYDYQDCDYYCSNCAKTALFEVKLDCASSDGVVESGSSNWINGFNVVKEREISGGVIYSVAMKYGIDKSDFNKTILEQSIGAETPSDSKMTFV